MASFAQNGASRGMRAGIAAALSALAMAPSASAQPEPTLDQFDSLCVKTSAVTQQVLAGADAAGWTALPDGAIDLSAVKGLTRYSLRTRSDGANRQVLMVADMDAGSELAPPGMKEFHGRFCMITGRLDRAATVAALKARMGFEPTMATETSVLYGFSESGGARKPLRIDDDAAAAASAKAGTLRLLGVRGNAELTQIFYLVDLPAAAN
jgi:hypothetical protein